MSTGVAQGAVELRQLFERFAVLSEAAVRACDAGDAAALTAALDARDLLTPRTAELTSAFSAARRSAATRASREAIDVALRPVQAAAVVAGQLNVQLSQRAQAARSAIGAQLDRLRQDESATSAYAHARGETSFLDVTR